MDAPDWQELLRGVEELGHGAIVFFDKEADMTELTVVEVVVEGDDIRVILE